MRCSRVPTTRSFAGFLHYEVVDAQCGFKAIRTSLARELIPKIEDNGWFFDTELLALAHRAGLRINQVPVRWVEDPDSRVRIVQTAIDDLKGVWRLWLDGKRGDLRQTARPVPSQSTLTSGIPHEEGRGVDFDTYASGYENAVDRSVSFTGRDSVFFARRKVDVLEDIVRPALGSLQGVSLLDVGCGTGTTDRFLAPRVRSLHGVDISEEMLAKAQRNVPAARFSWYDGEKLPFADETFDVVLAICVLHHVPMSKRFKVVERDGPCHPARGHRGSVRAQPVQPVDSSGGQCVRARPRRRAALADRGNGALEGKSRKWSPMSTTTSSPRSVALSASRSTVTSVVFLSAASTRPGFDAPSQSNRSEPV